MNCAWFGFKAALIGRQQPIASGITHLESNYLFACNIQKVHPSTYHLLRWIQSKTFQFIVQITLISFAKRRRQKKVRPKIWIAFCISTLMWCHIPFPFGMSNRTFILITDCQSLSDYSLIANKYKIVKLCHVDRWWDWIILIGVRRSADLSFENKFSIFVQKMTPHKQGSGECWCFSLLHAESRWQWWCKAVAQFTVLRKLNSG